jgi:hypothetical protein
MISIPTADRALSPRSDAPQATLLLLAAPAAEDYYPRLGFSRHPQAWQLRPGDALG